MGIIVDGCPKLRLTHPCPEAHEAAMNAPKPTRIPEAELDDLSRYGATNDDDRYQIERLVAEVRRLRGLIAETHESRCGCVGCGALAAEAEAIRAKTP
jgi:hypothetical protein